MKEQRLFNKGNLFLFQKNWWFPSKFPQLAADEEFAENPEKVKLLTLLKFQEEPKRLRIGFFNAITEKTKLPSEISTLAKSEKK